MMTDSREYASHPRYGREPRYTGLDVAPADPAVNLHWRTGCDNVAIRAMLDHQGLFPGLFLEPPCIVPGTAIVADPGRHAGDPCHPITHYYDQERTCRRCGRRFLFFAEEQKYWYEELGFNLNADCVDCHPCRHARQRLDRLKRRHDELLARSDRTTEESVELAGCCLRLIELGTFTPRRVERVRFLLNRLPPDWGVRAEVLDLRARLAAVAVDRPAN